LGSSSRIDWQFVGKMIYSSVSKLAAPLLAFS